MAKTCNYRFDEEAALLKAQARRFLAEHLPSEALHRLVAQDRGSIGGWDPALWGRIKELGWHTLAVPAAQGGAELSHMAVAGLVEEVGRAALPGPLASTLNAAFVLRHCTEGRDALADIASGQSATIAIADKGGATGLETTDVEYLGGALHGTAWFVQDALKSERFLVLARGAQGPTLFWVHRDTPGLAVIADSIFDLTRDQAHLVFDGVHAEPVARDAATALAKAMPAIWTMLAADIAGAAEWQLQATVDYVSTRKQFERPLGFFQAVKHPLVNVMIQVDETRSLLYHAASLLDNASREALLAAHMAMASACRTAQFASSRSVQYHGGVGFTWECHVQLYFKRQMHSRLLWGDANWHRARVADLLMGPLAA